MIVNQTIKNGINKKKPQIVAFFVGATGFEPVTLPTESREGLNQLSYAPILRSILNINIIICHFTDRCSFYFLPVYDLVYIHVTRIG